MVFSSHEFLFGFLPASFLGFLLLEHWGRGRAALAWVVLASLVFYSWWNPIYLPLLVGSMAVNFTFARALGRLDPTTQSRARKAIAVAGVAGNLVALGYFKYTGLLVSSIESMTGAELDFASIELPLAISFFTFQQVAYLVDAYRGSAPTYGGLQYAFFISFFPQLIAGPIVRHDQTIPQLATGRRLTSWRNVAVGGTILVIGLVKKVVFADGVAPWASTMFDAARAGVELGAWRGWTGTVAYTLQIYFDFSGYSDMAIGAARLFGIRLPLNFDSPYRSTSIAEFWRRWHITLSSFLRDYLYIPLGGNRRGESRRYANLMITMLLGGLWHGAAWTFVLWGGLHGLYLCVDHLWTRWRGKRTPSPIGIAASWALTLACVVLAWVLFRADGLSAAVGVYAGMFGRNGLGTLPPDAAGQAAILIALLAVSCFGPNTQQLMRDYEPALDVSSNLAPATAEPHWPRWRLERGWAVVVGLLAALAILYLERSDEFLYFQF